MAVFNLKSLVNRFAGYERSIIQENHLSKEIAKQEASELGPLKLRYNQASSIQLMSPAQEKHLQALQEHREDLSGWLKENAQDSNEIKSRVASELEMGKNMTKGTIKNEDKYLVQDYHSYGQLHDKLSGDIVGLAKQLLPNMSDKKIEIQKHKVICGSIQIEREGNKRGLWYRFSNGAEKGDLFDLIKVSQGLSDKKEAIEWGKSYLGLDRDNKPNTQVKINTRTPVSDQSIEANKVASFKVLSPVPQNAGVFNPKAVFARHISNKEGNNKEIEDVYAYKNIKNELCGYVVRIKDIEANTKVTLPAVYTENTKGIRSWRAKGLGEERCLYNEQRLYNSDKPVLIVEGEKTADVAQSLYPEFDVVTWSGGVNGFNKTNWSVLQDKQVTILPDNDKPGINAAHNIKSLLESKNIAKVQVIDTSKIEFLPEKWDLADKLPEDVRQHQITGALYEAKGIADNVRITKTLQGWKSYSNTDLDNKEFKSLGEYMLNKQAMKYQLHFEQILLRDKLQTKAVLSNLDGMLLDLEARKLVDNNIKSLSLSKDATSETISNQIQHDLAQIHQIAPKEVLIKATKIAMESSQTIIDEHSHNQTTKLSFTQADLPVLSLALASEIVEHHNNKDNSIETVNHDSNVNSARHEEHQEMSQQNLNNNDHDHSINMIRVAFKARIEQEGHNFEQHQQVIQRQMSQHQGIEI